MMKLLGFRKPKVDFWFFVKVIVILAMLFFLVYPFSTLITRSFFTKKVDGMTFDNYATFFSKKYYLDALKNTLYITFFSSLTCLLVGAPMAYLMTRYNIFGKKIIYVCIILAPDVPALYWRVFLDTVVWPGRIRYQIIRSIGIKTPTIYGPGGIILVFTLHLYPYVYLYVSGALSSIDSSLEEAGENLGSSKIRRLFTVTLPVVMPSILAGVVMVFMTSLADFGTPMLLGEGKTRVLPVLVYDAYMSEIGGDANMASTLSVIVVACSLSVLLLQKYYVARKNYAMTSLRPPKVVELRGWKRFLVTLPVAIVAFLGLLPQLTVVISSFIRTDFTGFIGGFTLENYEKILSRLKTNITNTYYFSAVAIVFIVIFGMLISYILVRKRGKVASIMDLLVMFPYVIPGSVLGVCLIVAFNRRPIILTGTAAIMIVSYVVRKLPYTVRSGSAFLYQMDVSVEEASVSLGISPMKTFFKVVARLMLPGILSGAILSWITCINELSSSIMLYSGKTSTISVAIYQEVMRMSDGTAAALASVLTLTTVLSLLIFLRLSKGKVSII